MKPILTLFDIFGPGYMYNGRASYNNSQWINPYIQDFNSGSMLTLAGKTPILSHKNVLHPACIKLLQDAGLPFAENIYSYEDEKSYLHLLKSLQNNDRKFVINYTHLPNEIDTKKYWIKADLLPYLNNKGMLEQLVPEPYVPVRHFLNIDQFMNDNFIADFPFVVKVATDEPNAGGQDVYICKNNIQLQEAKQFFKSSSHVIVEKFLTIKNNFCIQFIQTYSGDLIYLGASEQITNEEGKYKGNWIDFEVEPPEEAINVCKIIMKKAVSLGYWGFAGFDTVITDDNQIYVIDLNFRQNASTGALLFKESIMEITNSRIMKLSRWRTNYTFDAFKLVIEPLINQKKLIPLCIYFPNRTKDEILLLSLTVGQSREEIEQIEKTLVDKGFY